MSQKLSLSQALTWIIISIFVIPGSVSVYLFGKERIKKRRVHLAKYEIHNVHVESTSAPYLLSKKEILHALDL